MSFLVMTDTSGNLPTRLLRERDIRAIAFHYYVEGREMTCDDTDGFDAQAFYGMIRQGKRVTTSQITPEDYEAFFESLLREEKDILFVSMSSGISGSCASAHVGAREVLRRFPGRRIEIVDTRGASLGEGLLALQAADLRDGGMDTAAAAEKLRGEAERMFNVFTVDDLMHLRRSGRLCNLSAIMGTVLNIKPLLKGDEEGKIVAFAKIRGRKQSIRALAQVYERLAVDPETQTVGIAHAGCAEDAAALAEMLRANRPPRQILTVDYEPVTGSHVGPGALALFFRSREGVRSYAGEDLPNLIRQMIGRTAERIQNAKK